MIKIAELLEMELDQLEAQFNAHSESLGRLEKLQEYFMGEHDILSRTKQGSAPNNQIVSNHAKYITTMLTGYFLGNPVSHVASTKEADDDVLTLNMLYRMRYLGTHDYLIAKKASIMGVAYELMYISPDEQREVEGMPAPRLHNLDPRQTFLVRDNDLEETVKAGIHYNVIGDDEYRVYVYTDSQIITYITDNVYTGDYVEDTDNPSTTHLFGGVPIVEYMNEENKQGDFEQVITLIDAYNLLQSDRLNDKEQLVDAILMIKGGNVPEGGMKRLKSEKLLVLPNQNMDAGWLTKSLNEQEVEVLKNSIKKDIHEFSFTPNLTDENFAGTTSGEAMKFKLFGTEQVLQEKETFFEKGLRLRIKRLFYYLNNGDDTDDTYTQIKIGFNRALPTDMPNPVETFVQLYEKISTETLLDLLDFVEDVPGELVKIAAQQDARAEKEASAFDFPSKENIIPEEATDEEA